MKHRIALYLLFVAALCMGCGNALTKRELMALEARINEVPDSVLAVLTASDMPRWGEPRALYALLTVEAQDKSYIDVADDSLICVATRYYNRHGSPLHRLQAFYYQGRVYTNAGLRHEAMTAFTRAKDFVDEVDAPYPVGLLYTQLGVLYGNDYDYPQGLAYMEKAMQHYKQAGKERFQYVAMRNMGQLYLNMEQAEQAEALFNEVLTWGEAQGDTYIIYSTLRHLLRLYDATGDVEALGSLLKDYSIDDVLQSSSCYSIVAHYYARKGDKIAAKEALNLAWKVSTTAADTAMILHKSYQVNKVLASPYEALQDHELLFEHQDSVVRITLQQPLIASQLSHYQTRLQVEELRNQRHHYLVGMTILILFIIGGVLYIYVRNRFRRKQEELTGYMELAEDLRHTLSHREESIGRFHEELEQSHEQLDTLRHRVNMHEDSSARMQAQIAELFGTYSKLLNSLSETYYENQGSKSAIFAQIEKEIKKISEGNMIVELEAILNTNLDNIMARLRDELPHLKEKDYAFLTLLYARFSGKTIATFMKLERNHIYQIKHRLRDEIKSSDSTSRDFFLENLG